MKQSEVERQLAEFIGKYTPQIAASIHASREKLHGLFPRGFELVYDNYNALVFAFGPSERTSEVVLSFAAYPRWVTLFFARGASLSDPTSLLKGSGTQIRGITLTAPEQIVSAPVMELIAQAVAPVQTTLSKAPMLTTIVKSISAKQRARRPTALTPAKAKKPRDGR